MRRSKAKSRENLTISAPLGDFRHVGHIGKDGYDFGKEEMFQKAKKISHGSVSSVFGVRNNSIQDSPIIRSSIPIQRAIELNTKGKICSNSYSGIIDGNISRNRHSDYSLSDLDINEFDSSFGKLNLEEEITQQDSLLNEVLGVMENSKYRNLPGNIGYTNKKKEYRDTSNSDGINSLSTTSTDKKDYEMKTAAIEDEREEISEFAACDMIFDAVSAERKSLPNSSQYSYENSPYDRERVVRQESKNTYGSNELILIEECSDDEINL